MKELAERQNMQSRIYRIRGQQVMLGQDLADLYGVAAKRLSETVKRNIRRFPADFMFQLTMSEWDILKPQFAASSWGGIRRAIPFAFTEQGIAMLSSVLRSEQSIQINIAIMRAFVKLRHAMLAHQGIARRVEKLEGKVSVHDTDIRLLVQDVRDLKKKPDPKPLAVQVKGFQKESVDS
jgi:hypothetical protein